ncbi:hypothetical protein [Oryzisolibacter sp. LB2S]|uniref:hypothetical protein n=1 Tax=Alicycliphilus soli TaxID=3228789 RepID=UPI003457496F
MARTAKPTAPDALARGPVNKVGTSPIFGKAAALVLARQGLALVAHSLRRLADERADLDRQGQWDDANLGCALALEVVADRVAVLLSAPPTETGAAVSEWYRLGAVVALAARSYSQPKSFYGLCLAALVNHFESLPELWVVVEVPRRS